MIHKNLKYKSAFDIIGPIMVGPSSSHTAGAVKIGKNARKLFGEIPTKLDVTFYGSFAKTYKGHGTAVAVVAGILGFETYDERIPNAIRIAEDQGMSIEFMTSNQSTTHANTVKLELSNITEKLTVMGVSIGGGSIQMISIDQEKLVSENEKENQLIVVGDINEIPEISMLLDDPSIRKLRKLSAQDIVVVQTKTMINQNLLLKLSRIRGIKCVVPVIG